MARVSVDVSLYLVTDTALCGALGVPATVAAAVAAGVSVVQLRDPAATDAELVVLGRAVVAGLRGRGVPVLINDRVHLVQPVGAAGAHIGQRDLDPVRARAALGADAVLGLSVQTQAHVGAARGYGAAVVDYLGVGPVWAQATKPDAADPVGLSGFAGIAAMSPLPCVAIGGITADRAAQVKAVGGAGVAVVSGICGQPDVRAATQRLRCAWDREGVRVDSVTR